MFIGKVLISYPPFTGNTVQYITFRMLHCIGKIYD